MQNEKRRSFRLASKNASVGTKTFELSFAPQYDEDGKLIGAIALAADVSERVQHEAQLLAIERRLRTTLENAPLILTEIDGSYLVYDGQACSGDGLVSCSPASTTWTFANGTSNGTLVASAYPSISWANAGF